MRKLILAGAVFLLVCAPARAGSGPPDADSGSPRFEGKDATRVRTAMTNMRQIAIAIEEFAVANNRYPRPGRTTEAVGPYRLGPVASVQFELGVTGIDLPAVDPWGGPYLYWSSGKDYVLVCLGSDGTLTEKNITRDVIARAERDGNFEGKHEPLPAMTCAAQEVIFGDGVFVRYPTVPLGECR
jgi:hypothetical protein